MARLRIQYSLARRHVAALAVVSIFGELTEWRDYLFVFEFFVQLGLRSEYKQYTIRPEEFRVSPRPRRVAAQRRPRVRRLEVPRFLRRRADPGRVRVGDDVPPRRAAVLPRGETGWATRLADSDAGRPVEDLTPRSRVEAAVAYARSPEIRYRAAQSQRLPFPRHSACRQQET